MLTLSRRLTRKGLCRFARKNEHDLLTLDSRDSLGTNNHMDQGIVNNNYKTL